MKTITYDQRDSSYLPSYHFLREFQIHAPADEAERPTWSLCYTHWLAMPGRWHTLYSGTYDECVERWQRYMSAHERLLNKTERKDLSHARQ